MGSKAILEPSTNRMPLLRISLIIAILAGLSLGPAIVQAQPPTPEDRFRWVEGLDDLYLREHGMHLSRPLPARQRADIPLPDPSFTVDFTRYPTSVEMVAFLDELEATYPELVEVMEVGRSWQERPIMAVRIGGQAAEEADGRPALYVDGQHHAREAVSAQVVLYFVWYLASQYGSDPLVTYLLDTRTVYAIPSVNPDGNDIFLDADQRQRKTANPQVSDDDGDGLFDEDPPEGAGYGTYNVYIYEFDPDWVDAHPEDPLAPGWGAHLLGQTYRGVFDGQGREIVQQDNDGDGRFSEDPYGGVDANRNYDSHWELGNDDPRTEIYSGPTAFSEQETRAVRDFVLARPNIVTASSFHSGSDVLLHPWGWSATEPLPDWLWYEKLSRKGSQVTEANGFHGAPHTWTARGLYAGSGSTMDWLYEQGILTWTPEAYGASLLSFTQRITTTNAYTVGLSMGEAFNPSPAEIPLTADRWLRWNLYLLAATPNVGLSGVDVGAGALTVTVANDGLLPLDVGALVEMEGGTYRTTVDSLSSGERAWSVLIHPESLTQTATITLTARSRVGIAPGPLQVDVVKLEIHEGAVRVLEGRLEPFMELEDFFGGWFAGREWDTPEYHLGPPLLFELCLPIVMRSR